MYVASYMFSYSTNNKGIRVRPC